MSGRFKIDCGPFAQTREDVNNFCHNLYLSYAMSECALQLKKVEEEYNEALLMDDEELIQEKKLQLQAYQSSLTLTAYMFEEVDEVST
jgi:hypothetical protein